MWPRAGAGPDVKASDQRALRLLWFRCRRRLRCLAFLTACASWLLGGSRRKNKLLANRSQIGLCVRQLLPGGLQLAVHLSQIPVLSCHVLGQLGQLLLSLSPLLFGLLDFRAALVMVGGQGRKGLLALGSLLGDLLNLPAYCHKLLFQRHFCLPGLLDALLGLSDIGGLGRHLFRQSGKPLACLGLLLAGSFELLSNLRQLLSAISHQLRMGCEFVERRAPALLSLLRLGLRLGQLLHLILKLLSV